jgi:hypothetical protein
LSYHNISFREIGMDGERHCRYAMVMEATKFRFRTAYLNGTNFWDEHKGKVPIILDWAVGNKTCDVAKEEDAGSYAC